MAVRNITLPLSAATTSIGLNAPPSVVLMVCVCTAAAAASALSTIIHYRYI